MYAAKNGGSDLVRKELSDLVDSAEASIERLKERVSASQDGDVHDWDPF